MLHQQIILGILLITVFFSQNTLAQITDKPELEFEVVFNEEKEEVDVIWPSCLENTVVSLLDNGMHPIRTVSLCKQNNSIDVSKLPTDLYYLKIEHYTGESILPMPLKATKELAAETNQLIEFVAAPNPAKNTVIVSTTDVLEGATLQLMDVSGKTLQHQQINAQETTLDITELGQGVYFVRIELNGTVGVQKIVKQ